MQPRPAFDRELLIPTIIAIVSILGLAWIFFTNDRGETPLTPTLEPTAVPFEITPFELEVHTPAHSATASPEEILPTAPGGTPNAYPGPPEETTPLAEPTGTGNEQVPSATSTPGQVLPAGKYDNTHPGIAYDRHWAFRMNSGTEDAYRGTLHISSGLGSEASFHFTGQRLRLGYQRGRNFGTVKVLIDGQTYTFHEQAFDRIWRSPQLSPGIHAVRIIHETGESVNLDYVEVLD